MEQVGVIKVIIRELIMREMEIKVIIKVKELIIKELIIKEVEIEVIIRIKLI